LEINVKFKLQTCLACQDLLTMQFWSKFHYLFWSRLRDLLQNCMVGRSCNAEHVCSLNLTFISNSFWNKGRKVLKCWKFDEKREIIPKWVMGFTSKLHGRQILTCWTCLQFKLNIYLQIFNILILFVLYFKNY
jgi:hypothetical protein